ncbi:hypothetical protein [Stomatohabitans albus]|uniref:hypothetical protein n=1 Tax=Stomatohabitans albus TaxID=3110766 RepID=UPI00300C4BE8
MSGPHRQIPVDDLLDWAAGRGQRRIGAAYAVAAVTVFPAITTYLLVVSLTLSGATVSPMAVLGIAWAVWSLTLLSVAIVADGTPKRDNHAH